MILLGDGFRPIVLVMLCLALLAAGCARGNGQEDEIAIFENSIRSFGRKGTWTVVDCNSNIPLFFKEQQANSCTQALECWQVSPELEARSMELMPTLRLGTWRSFVASNAGPHRLCDNWLPPAGVLLGALPEGHVEYLHLELSKVGFDEAGVQALIYVGLLEGQAGRGLMILFEFRSGEWVEVARVQAWIA